MLLPEIVANQIAAGEVVNGPANVVKEMMENSLDAGATSVSVNYRNGGKDLIQIIDNGKGMSEEDLPIVLSQYEELAKLMLTRHREGKPFTFYHYMIDLTGGPCIYKRISGCGSGTEYMAVTPWGDLYPCHQFVGDEKFKLGDIWNGVDNKEIQQEFMDCNVYAREGCKDCWAKLYCSGGCAANAYHATGSVRGIYEYGCKLFRKRMECAIALTIAKMLEE